MRVIVLGAGAIGSLYGAKLSARHDVTLVARGDHVRAIREHGLRLDGIETGCYRVNATSRLDAIAPETLILLTTKVGDSADAIAPIVPLLDPSVTILCVQNGLYAEGIVRDLVGERALTLRAITQFGAILRAPGVIDYKVAGYTLIEQHDRAPDIAALLTGCGLDGRVTADMKHEMWRKVIFNCVINPITSLVGCHVGGIEAPGLAPLKRLVIDECLAVARADGVTFDVDFIQLIGKLFGPSTNVASMRQDLMRGRRTEIDHLNGAVAALGARYGVDCPVNQALTAIVKALEGRGTAA